MSIDTTTAPTAIPVPDEIRNAPVPFDLYREVHKGLRSALFQLTVTVGETDCADPAGRALVAARTEQLIGLLHAHHHHEDRFIQPLIVATAPALAEAIEAGHAETERDIAAIEALVDALVDGDGEGAVRIGLELYHLIALFTSRYLAHMAVEEHDVMSALRAAVSLEELFAAEVAIRSTVAPPLMVEFMGVMVPAMNPDERTNMLGGMRAGAPAEIFELFRQAAEDALSPEDYAVVAGRIGVA